MFIIKFFTFSPSSDLGQLRFWANLPRPSRSEAVYIEPYEDIFSKYVYVTVF